MYVDESGDVGLRNSPTNYFVLSALVVHEKNWLELLDSLKTFRTSLKQTKKLKLRDEIHASAFINSPGKLQRIKRNDRLDILKQTLNWAAQHSAKISTFSVVIDKPQAMVKNIDVFETAWLYLIQRFENTLKYQNFPEQKILEAPQYGMLFCDNTNGTKLREILRKMRRYNPIPQRGGGGFTQNNMYLIIEDEVMRDSKHSYFIQIADVIAYFVKQKFEPNAYCKKKGAITYYNRLQPIYNILVSPRKDGIVLYP